MKRRQGYFLKIFYLIISLTILYFILVPITSVFIYGFTSGNETTIADPIMLRVWKYMRNSLKVAFSVTIVSTLFGLIASIVLWRIRFFGRKLMRALVLMPLFAPPFFGSVSFIMLFGKRGLITHNLLGLEISPFGFFGVFLMQTIGLSTLAYLLISSAIKKTDIANEEAARNLGASEFRIFMTITLPLMIPEITVAAMLVFLTSLSDFTTPIIIGGGFQTLASDLYIQITGLYNMKTASISGMFLFIPCFIAFFIQRYYSNKNLTYSHGVVGDAIEYPKVKRGIAYMLIGLTSLFVIFVAVQYAFIVIGAFTENWGYDYSFTLKYLNKILTRGTGPFINSFKLALTVGIISSLIGVLLAYFIKSKKYPLAKHVDFIATLPAAVPGILFGIGYLVTFKYPILGVGKYYLTGLKPVILLGTGIIIYLICIYRYLYVGMKSGYALLEHVNPNLEEAAVNLGASEGRVFLNIMFPMLKPAFNVAFLKNFTSSMTTLGAIIFLLLPKNKVAVQQIFQIMTSSEIGMGAMMALMLSLFSATLLGCFKIILNYKEVMINLKECFKWVLNLKISHRNMEK